MITTLPRTVILIIKRAAEVMVRVAVDDLLLAEVAGWTIACRALQQVA